jgi:ABC-2 type transport system ATP-binding protein
LRAQHGESVVMIGGPSPALLASLEALYPGQLRGDHERLTLRPRDPAPVIRLVADTPGGARSLSVHAPSLEDVFLDLTGRGLREEQAGANSATLGFARGGGEHTR